MTIEQRLPGAPLPGGLDVESAPDVGEARRLAAAAAQAQGFTPVGAGRACLVATEMATNLVKYASSGRILVRLIRWGERRGVELVSIDRGPGMDDVARRTVDGFSSGGTAGEGLGAIARVSDLADVYSLAGAGTVAMARLWDAVPETPSDRRFLVGAVAEAIPGEFVSGDAWAVEQRGGRLVALVADGLGHGVHAAEASAAAVEVLRLHHREQPDAIVGHVHRALRHTRGAAVAVAEIDLATGAVRYCGVGNISARIVGAGPPVNLMSHYGIAGHQARRIRAVEAAWEPESLLVMHSDGLSTKWDLGAYPGLHRHHPVLAAATVARDAVRRHDDATVLVVRAATRTAGQSPDAGGEK